MLCILRVAGTNLDVDEMLSSVSARPFRVDRSKSVEGQMSALHFEVFDRDQISREYLNETVAAFMTAHEVDIKRFRHTSSVDFLALDFSLLLGDQMASSSIEFRSSVLEQVGKLGVAIVVSTYG